MHHHTVNLVEFCAGYCGIGIGLKSVVRNLRTIAYVEREAYPVANLAAKIESGRLDAAPIWSDLLDFPYGKFRGLVDIAAAGIPCQPHSHAGLRRGGGDERFLFDDWLRGLQQMRPRCILIENVEGLLTSQMPDGTLCIRWTLERLERMGYRTASGIFSAEECGAPHRRNRVFIIATDTVCERGQLSVERIKSAIQDIGSDGTARRAEDWNNITSWSIEPTICRNNDGATNRVDRLRLLGNGVVPATAALAFRTLAREILG